MRGGKEGEGGSGEKGAVSSFIPGKSLSDMLGSQCKIALEKGAARDAEFTARTAEEVAAVMTANLSEKTKQFYEVKIFVVEPFERPLKKPGCKTPTIQLVRHVSRVAGGGLLTREIACVPCLELGTTLCPTCAALPPTWQETDPAAAEQVPEQEGEENREDEHREGQGVQGAAAADQMLEEEEEARGAREEEQEQEDPGEVMWARERRNKYWPCQVVLVDMVPAATIRKFGRVAANTTWVRMLGEGRGEHRPMPPYHLVPLQPGTPFDVAASGEDEAVMAAYTLAMMAKMGF